MTFRRLFSADGIHDYFWKARPVRDTAQEALMGSHGIKDRVAIVGMGCTKFGERFDMGLDDLIIDASSQAFSAAGIDKDAVDAYWFGTAQSGMSGITLARPLQLEGKPVTRVENYCATGSDALRQAAYAVASGAYDVAMAIGAEKVKDSGYAGLNAFPVPNDGTARTLTAAAMFSMVAPGVRQAVRRRRDRDQGRARPHRVEEPLQRRAQPAGAVPAGDEHGDDLRVAACGRPARHPRLRRRRRRRGRRDRRAGRRRGRATRTSRCT